MSFESSDAFCNPLVALALVVASLLAGCRVQQQADVPQIHATASKLMDLGDVPQARDMYLLGPYLFIATPRPSGIWRIDLDTKVIERIVREGQSPFELLYPTSVTGDGRRLYVSDLKGLRIAAFDIDGKFIRTLRDDIAADEIAVRGNDLILARHLTFMPQGDKKEDVAMWLTVLDKATGLTKTRTIGVPLGTARATSLYYGFPRLTVRENEIALGNQLYQAGFYWVHGEAAKYMSYPSEFQQYLSTSVDKLPTDDVRLATAMFDMTFGDEGDLFVLSGLTAHQEGAHAVYGDKVTVFTEGARRATICLPVEMSRILYWDGGLLGLNRTKTSLWKIDITGLGAD